MKLECGADEGTRLDLLSRVDAGLDTSSAASAAASAMQMTPPRGKSSAMYIGDLYDSQHDAKRYAEALRRRADRFGAFFRSPNFSGWTAIFAAIPAFLGGFAFMKSESLPFGIAAVVGGVLIMGVLHTFLIPLVRSDA